MHTTRFVYLCKRLESQTATKEELSEFILHAKDLRSEVIAAVSESDTWDQDWPCLGYACCADDRDDVQYDLLREWADTWWKE